MGILDVFRFKKDFSRYFSVENIKDVVSFARRAILSQANKDMSGPEKKAIVDELVAGAISSKVTTCTNKLVLWVHETLVKSVPDITQLMYDFLKEKVENL